MLTLSKLLCSQVVPVGARHVHRRVVRARDVGDGLRPVSDAVQHNVVVLNGKCVTTCARTRRVVS